MNRRMKMDINNWVRQVDDVLLNSRSKIVRENGYGISVGLDLLLAYLSGGVDAQAAGDLADVFIRKFVAGSDRKKTGRG